MAQTESQGGGGAQEAQRETGQEKRDPCRAGRYKCRQALTSPIRENLTGDIYAHIT